MAKKIITNKTAKKKVAKKKPKKKVAQARRFKQKIGGDIIAEWLDIKKGEFKDWDNREFWKRESAILYRICDKYGNEFIENLTPFIIIDSMLVLESPFFQTKLKELSLAWHYSPTQEKTEPHKLLKRRVAPTIKPINTSIKQWLK